MLIRRCCDAAVDLCEGPGDDGDDPLRRSVRPEGVDDDVVGVCQPTLPGHFANRASDVNRAPTPSFYPVLCLVVRRRDRVGSLVLYVPSPLD